MSTDGSTMREPASCSTSASNRQAAARARHIAEPFVAPKETVETRRAFPGPARLRVARAAEGARSRNDNMMKSFALLLSLATTSGLILEGCTQAVDGPMVVDSASIGDQDPASLHI